jgi:hypothetical protein
LASFELRAAAPHASCWCQKHPCTNTAILFDLIMKSGLPGSHTACSSTFSRVLASIAATVTSGLVPVDLIFDMISERLLLVKTSAMIPSAVLSL